MQSPHLEWLYCPVCATRLQVPKAERVVDESGHGILSCRCSVYPVVAGIPIFKNGGVTPAGHTSDELIALIRSGRYRDALLALLSPPSPSLVPPWMHRLPRVKGVGRLRALAHKWVLRTWHEQAMALMGDPDDSVTTCDVLQFVLTPNSDYYYHFACRFGQPRHLVALSLACVIRDPRKPVLDVACGFGHITYGLLHRAGSQPVIGIDESFRALYIAKNWIAPEADYVCCDAQTFLPFPDGFFSTAVCSDSFHYFLDKESCIRELRRLTKDDGTIILAVMRNALVDYPAAGSPLVPESYRALIADMPHCLMADSDILARYLRKEGPSLVRSSDTSALAQAPTLSAIASYRHEPFQEYGPFKEWPHAQGHLGLNPLYVQCKVSDTGTASLRRVFPSAWYERDNAECEQYLPERVDVAAGVLRDLERGQRTPDAERLAERFVALGMPKKYRPYPMRWQNGTSRKTQPC